MTYGPEAAKMRANAALAQLVEQFIRNEKVASSNPASGTRRSSQGIFAIPIRAQS